jgi:hypothetical protein
VVAIGEHGFLKKEHVEKIYFNRVYNFKWEGEHNVMFYVNYEIRFFK